MKVLGIDTSTLSVGIAIVDDDRVLAELVHDAGARTADLLVAIDDACRRAAISPTKLDAIAIGAGPGSFTGLRIGMATAKGIAFAAGTPLWAVSSLAALAHDAGTTLGDRSSTEHMDHVIAAVLDARKGEVFAGCYRSHILLGEERVLAPTELVAWVESLAAPFGAPITYAGNALAGYPALAPLAPGWIAATPSGRAVAHLALTGPRLDVLTSGAPAYIRPSEAEIRYPDGVPGALRRR